jgi:hypothetical protein
VKRGAIAVAATRSVFQCNKGTIPWPDDELMMVRVPTTSKQRERESETDGLRRKKLELSEFASSYRLQVVVQSKRQELTLQQISWQPGEISKGCFV